MWSTQTSKAPLPLGGVGAATSPFSFIHGGTMGGLGGLARVRVRLRVRVGARVRVRVRARLVRVRWAAWAAWRGGSTAARSPRPAGC